MSEREKPIVEYDPSVNDHVCGWVILKGDAEIAELVYMGLGTRAWAFQLIPREGFRQDLEDFFEAGRQVGSVYSFRNFGTGYLAKDSEFALLRGVEDGFVQLRDYRDSDEDVRDAGELVDLCICPHCYANNPDGVQACSSCGRPIEDSDVADDDDRAGLDLEEQYPLFGLVNKALMLILAVACVAVVVKIVRDSRGVWYEAVFSLFFCLLAFFSLWMFQRPKRRRRR